MMTPEQLLNRWVHDALRAPGVDIMRVESLAMAGVPDINVCASGIEAWIECKVGPHVIMRKEQYAWGMRRANAGGLVYVLVGTYPDIIQVHQYPSVQVSARDDQKTLELHVSPHTITHDRDHRALRRSLFPMLAS